MKKNYDLQLHLYNKQIQGIRKQQRLILLRVKIKRLHNKGGTIMLKITYFMAMLGKIKEGQISC